MSFLPLLGALSSTIQYYEYNVDVQRKLKGGEAACKYWLKVLEAVNRVWQADLQY